MIPWKPFIVSGLTLKQKVKPQSGVSKRIATNAIDDDAEPSILRCCKNLLSIAFIVSSPTTILALWRKP